MGLIRGGLLTVVSVLFLLGVLVGSLFLTLSMSLDYEVVRPEFKSALKEVAVSQMDLGNKISQMIPQMKFYCQNNSEYVFAEQDYSFVISCVQVEAGDVDEIINSGINDVVEKQYYQDYDCSLFDCLSEGKTGVLISQKAKNYWSGKFYILFFLVFILFICMFFLVEKKSNSFVIAGALLIVGSLPFSRLEFLASFIGKIVMSFMMPEIQGFSLTNLFMTFLSRSLTVFWEVLITGISFLIIGVIMKILGIGFKINELFSKGKKVVKEKVIEEKE